MRLTACSVIFISAAFAQGTETKAKPANYPVHGTAGDTAIGAEYMVQSVSSPRGSFIADKFLVVEVAVFPPPGGKTISSSSFSLRINDKDMRVPQTTAMVAASIKYPDWNHPRGIQATAGPIILGQPTRVERFPGDNRPAQSRIPGPIPRVPTDADGGSDSAEQRDPAELVESASLPEGPRRQPVSGYLFFPYEGKLTKIKKVELLVRFDESSEPVALRLR